jgi:uncharacterized protein YyaL (SSP411 family)
MEKKALKMWCCQYMNANFVCIKVDREERPDVDQVYMTAAQLLTGSGGGPECTGLSRWKTIFAGTYSLKKTGSKCYIIL